MLKKFSYIFLIGTLASGLTACKDDDLFLRGTSENGEIPVEFEIILPESNPSTRSMVNPKKSFSQGEVIHVEAEFTLDDGRKKEVYGALTYNETKKKWETLKDQDDLTDNAVIKWPNNAVSGKFKAFYIYGSNAILQPGTSVPTTPMSLSTLTGTSGNFGTPDKDPLQSINNAPEKYGHTAQLRFEHACGYLIIDELPLGMADVFWFTQKQGNGYNPEFKTAFQLTMSDDNHMSLDFVQQPEPNGLVYVAGEAATQTYEESGQTKAYTGFFLAPGDYKYFTIGFPENGGNSMESFLSYTKSPAVPGDTTDQNPNNTIESNGIYRFNVSKSKGIIKEGSQSGETWDESDDFYVIVNPEDFLYAIYAKQEYWNQDSVKILETTPTGTKLIHNIDFQYKKYTVFPPGGQHPTTYWDPKIGNGNVFDGGYHFIRNLGSPLFHENSGTIRNLGIMMVKDTVVSYSNVDDLTFDMSRQGALVGLNSGNINNVRFKDGLEMTVQQAASSSQDILSIGCLIGSNTGTATSIRLEGNFTLNIENYTDSLGVTNSTAPQMNIGGIAGINTNNINDVSPYSGSPVISIYNSCDGPRGEYNIGGIVGDNDGGTVVNVMLPSITVDSRESFGLISRIGGSVGRMNDETGSSLYNCVVQGTVLAGISRSDGGTLSSQSYTGGMVGQYFNCGFVNGCSNVVNVAGPNEYQENVIVGVGGVFGIISETSIAGGANGEIGDLIANGNSINGPQYKGNFAGIAPIGKTWEPETEPEPEPDPDPDPDPTDPDNPAPGTRADLWPGYSSMNIRVKNIVTNSEGEPVYIGINM